MSKEHIIPQAAGNSGRIDLHTLGNVLGVNRRTCLFQNGMFVNSLCGKCNNRAGELYVGSFARWTSIASEFHARLGTESGVLLPFTITPLTIAKQLAVMTLAMSHPKSMELEHFVRLRHFASHPRQSGGIHKWRFFSYFHFGPAVMDNNYARLRTDTGQIISIMCHVALEPLGYVVVLEDSQTLNWAAELRLCDLTKFAFRPHGLIQTEYLRIPVIKNANALRI